MGWSNISGMIGKSMTLGIGPNRVQFNFDVSGDQALHIDRPLVVDGASIRSLTRAKQVDEMVNLGLLNEMQEELYDKAIDYTNRHVLEMLGSGDGPGTPGNLMLTPAIVEASQLSDGFTMNMGDLKKSKFIYQIVIELTEKFHLEDGTRYECSVGTAEDPEYFVPYVEMTSNQFKTKAFDVLKTLTDDCDIIIYVRKTTSPTMPSDFEYRLINEHAKYVTGTMSHDPSGIMTNISLTSTYVGTEDIHDLVNFPNLTGKKLLDFGFNIPVTKGRHYRIVENNNPALEFLKDQAGVSNTAGIWSCTTDFTAESEEEVYPFILGRATTDSDYVHFLVYDLDSEDPTMAYKAYNVYNGIRISQEESPIPTENDFVWREPNAIPEHEYSEPVTGTGDVEIDAGDGVTVKVEDPHEELEIKKTVYYDKTVDITYIAIRCMDDLTGLSATGLTEVEVKDGATDLIDLNLTMKLMPVDSPYYIKESNPALAKVASVSAVAPSQDADGNWTIVQTKTTSSNEPATEIVHPMVLTYPEDSVSGDTIFIGVYTAADCSMESMQRLYCIQNYIGIEKDNPVIPVELRPATYTTLGGVIVDKETMNVDTAGKVSLSLATPDEVRAIISGGSKKTE